MRENPPNIANEEAAADLLPGTPDTPDTYDVAKRQDLKTKFPDAEIADLFLRDDVNGFKWRKALLVLPDGHVPGQEIIGIWWDASYVPKELREQSK